MSPEKKEARDSDFLGLLNAYGAPIKPNYFLSNGRNR